MTSLHSFRTVNGRTSHPHPHAHSPVAALRTERLHRPILVHSPLRWGPGSERPRQVFSRLAAHHPILYVEPPMVAALDGVSVQLTEPHPNVVRAVPLLPQDMPGADDVRRAATARALNAMLSLSGPDGSEDALRLYGEMARGSASAVNGHANGHRTTHKVALAARFQGAIQWFCSPLDAPVFLGRFGTMGVVYDRAGALAMPQRQAPDFAERDRSLMRQADLVFQDLVSQSTRRASSKAPPESREAHARRVAWDAIVGAMRSQLLVLDPTPYSGPLPARFLAASVVAFGLS